MIISFSLWLLGVIVFVCNVPLLSLLVCVVDVNGFSPFKIYLSEYRLIDKLVSIGWCRFPPCQFL